MQRLFRFGAFLLAAFCGLLAFVPIVSATTLTATPSSGASPLTVTFSASDNNAAFFDFGDTKKEDCSGPCATATHQYVSPGIYTAKLIAVSQRCGTPSGCITSNTIVASARVTVGQRSIFPTCQININPSVIRPGGSVTIEWSSQNAVSGAITNVGNVGPNGSRTILPGLAQVTTYVGSFSGPGGTANCQATVQISYGTVSGTDTSGAGVVNQNPTLVTPTQVGVGQNTDLSLVTCGTGGYDGTDKQQSSTGCQACNLAQLVSNIINFIIGISIPLAAALFAFAGVLYFTSGASQSNLAKAKSIFSTAFIGFVLICTSWLIINTLLHVLLDNGKIFSGGNWFTVQCAAQGQRPVNKSITDVINSVLPGMNGNPNGVVSGDPSITTAPTGGACDPTLGCFDANGIGVSNDLGNPYQKPSSYSQCYSGDSIQDGQCVGNGDTYTPFAASSGRAGPMGTCSAGYKYIDNSAGEAWCQGSSDDDVLDFLPAGKGSGPILTCNTGSSSCGNIGDAIDGYIGQSTLSGPGNGNVACAWAVNNVLTASGIAPIDGNSVASMQQQLEYGGRGTRVSDISQAQEGDIIVWKGVNSQGKSVSHVGFCADDGCDSTISNSSSAAKFNNEGGPVLLGIMGKVYHVNK